MDGMGCPPRHHQLLPHMYRADVMCGSAVIQRSHQTELPPLTAPMVSLFIIYPKNPNVPSEPQDASWPAPHLYLQPPRQSHSVRSRTVMSPN
ncbi:hypothetical protein GDO81_023046 [Engystomops pustulosus]|uniref:Uncharacterized protein n=1 Tax=Engystomops pustulosus TaxID=76066 RepID=A0AAV6YLD1_ENGPU|nr:hypothetical protein GDO81_023046 [Engystomops pustulosus]